MCPNMVQCGGIWFSMRSTSVPLSFGNISYCFMVQYGNSVVLFTLFMFVCFYLGLTGVLLSFDNISYSLVLAVCKYLARCSLLEFNMVQYGTIRYYMLQSSIWQDMVQYDAIYFVWFSIECNAVCMVQFSAIWFCVGSTCALAQPKWMLRQDIAAIWGN